MLVTQFDKFVNRSTKQILGSTIERENLVPMLSTDIPAKLQNIKITENGIYYPETGYDGFYEVEADIPTNLQDITITENGTYYPAEGYDGIYKVDVNIPTNTGTHYILNPAWSRQVSGSLGSGRLYQLASYIAYVVGSSSYNYAVANFTVDGVSTPCIKRSPAYYSGYISFAQPVPSDASKLFVQIQYQEQSSNYGRNGNLVLGTVFDIGETAIKTIHFVNSSMTVEEINSQTGVTINSTNNKSLSMQIVEIDISELNYDLYLRFYDANANPILAGIWYVI